MADTLGDRFWSKVDTGAGPDRCWLWTASCNPKGYGQFWHNGRLRLAHRVIMEMITGEPLGDVQVDHTCHVRHCVNPMHLRLVTNKQNHENLAGANRNSKSGIRGVSLHKESGLWRGTVTHNGKHYNVGYFKSVEEAGEAVRLKRLELFTHSDADRVTTRP